MPVKPHKGGKRKATRARAKNKAGRRHWLAKVRPYVRAVGPGLVTGAADNDPSGIGTFAKTGAQFGYVQLWLAALTLPMMIVVQEVCARIGLATGRGLAQVIRDHYPRWLLYGCVGLLVVANTINIGADLMAMAASGGLLVKQVPVWMWMAGFVLITALAPAYLNYRRYEKVLRLLCVFLLAYIAQVFLTHQPWGQVLRHTVVPTLRMDFEFWENVAAVMGTSISPYMFFWQASQEVEEEILMGRTTIAKREDVTGKDLKVMRFDVVSGMTASQLTTWCIIIAAAIH